MLEVMLMSHKCFTNVLSYMISPYGECLHSVLTYTVNLNVQKAGKCNYFTIITGIMTMN